MSERFCIRELYIGVWVPLDAHRIAGIARKLVWVQPLAVPFCKSFWAWPRVEYKRQMWLWHRSAPNKDKVWKEERPLQEWKCKNCSEVGTELSGCWKELNHRNRKNTISLSPSLCSVACYSSSTYLLNCFVLWGMLGIQKEQKSIHHCDIFLRFKSIQSSSLQKSK